MFESEISEEGIEDMIENDIILTYLIQSYCKYLDLQEDSCIL